MVTTLQCRQMEHHDAQDWQVQSEPCHALVRTVPWRSLGQGVGCSPKKARSDCRFQGFLFLLYHYQTRNLTFCAGWRVISHRSDLSVPRVRYFHANGPQLIPPRVFGTPLDDNVRTSLMVSEFCQGYFHFGILSPFFLGQHSGCDAPRSRKRTAARLS